MNPKNIFGACTLAVALFFLWPGVWGSWQEVQALRSAVSERKQLVDARTTILTNAAQEYTKYQAVISTDEGKNFLQLVPVKKNTAEIVSAAYDIAQQSGVELSRVLVSESREKEGDQYKTLSLLIDLTGSYSSFRNFLGSLEQYVRILNVGSIEITAGDSPEKLTFSVKAEAYFLK